MELTYLFHSGFALEADKCLLIFDCWMDPSKALKPIFERCGSKKVYVFASHFHEDHFTKKIFSWRQAYPEVRFTYILSKDIVKRKRASIEDADVWMVKGNTWQDENIRVVATGSNDSGVSWMVEVEGKRIFHAGDLCNWYARFLSEAVVPETIISEEFGEIHPIAEEKQFLGELKDIQKVSDHFDVVMFPVDGRIGNGYTLGARQFIERFKVGLFVPMHFVMSGFESAWRMEPFCQEKNIPFWCIREEGEQLSILDDILIRKTTANDIPRLREIFSIARQFMKNHGNQHQWADDYPSEELLLKDCQSGDSYVCVQANEIVATFVLRGGIDPTYNQIKDGAWMNDDPYATIHRIASSGKVKGIFALAMRFALQHYRTIRIDTHADNVIMRNAVLKMGFKYCGIIYCWNGSERLAYQF